MTQCVDVKSLNKEVRREKIYRITSYTLHRGLEVQTDFTDCVNSCHVNTLQTEIKSMELTS
jgi:hypothetical protein